MKNITCENFEDQVEYTFSRLECQDSCTVICDRTIAKEISKLYEENEFEDYYGVEISSEEDVYIIGKFKNQVFSIEPAFSANNELLGFDEDDVVLVQSELYKEDIKEYLKDFDNVVVIGLEDEEDYCCENCCEDCDDVVDEMLNEYVEEIQELGFVGCSHCLKKILDDLCYKIYSEGRDDEAFALHDMLNERLFGEN